MAEPLTTSIDRSPRPGRLAVASPLVVYERSRQQDAAEEARPGADHALELQDEAPRIRHLGPMAQDFRSAFGLGEDNRHIDTVADSEGVALAAIQGLYRQNRALERENQSLNDRLLRLERTVAKITR